MDGVFSMVSLELFFLRVAIMSKIIIYKSTGGEQVSVRLEGDSLWLTQEQIGELFKQERSVITKHLRNIFKSGELIEKSNVQNLHVA